MANVTRALPMEGTSTPARASTSQEESQITPDSLVDKAFENEMDRIMLYKEKYPKLDTDSMVAAAIATREKRKQDVFARKLAKSEQMDAPCSLGAMFMDDERDHNSQGGRASHSKRKRSPSVKSQAKPSGLSEATQTFVASIERDIRAATTR